MRKVLKNVLQYLLAIVIALGIALCLRLFVVDFFVVPSDSMYPAIEPGDFILVDKLAFGARMFRDFDFLEDGSEPRLWRTKGFSGINHGDVLVFNFPYCNDWNKIRMNLSRFYVKRCIGLPGDTLAIREGFYEINGLRGFGNLADQEGIAEYEGEFPEGIYHTIPFEKELDWNIRNMGPFYIPAAGREVVLDSINILIYRKMIEYETGLPLRCRARQLFCGDSVLSAYCFRSDWYFMGGDRMWNSQDSRYIGMIPAEFIVGKAWLVLTSRETESGKYNWRRFFTRIR